MANRKRILIADDNDESLVELMAWRFERMDLQVDRAFDGQSALRLIHEHQPDLVILDGDMLRGPGSNAFKMLWQDLAFKSIPVVILAGREDEEAVRLGGHYVPKGPDMWSALQPLIEQLLEVDRIETISPAGDAAPSASHSSGDETATDAPRRPADARPSMLCIDCHPEFAESLKPQLEQRGIEFVQAVEGMAGYWAAFSHPPEIILLDQQLPDVDGEYVLRRLKENPVTKDIPVFVLASSQDKALEREMYHLGATRFLIKPVDGDELWDEMRGHIKSANQAAT